MSVIAARALPILTCVIAVAAVPTDAAPPPPCTASTSSEWLTATPAPPDPIRPIEGSRVFAVSGVSTMRAIVRLAQHSAVPLTPIEADFLVGKPVSASGFPGVLRPYLVRAVFPTATPAIVASWQGNVLRISAVGMGCAPFRKQPVVVFLERAPARVVVNASAAL